MNCRIGVIGASESVENILKAGEHFAPDVTLIPCPFEKEGDMKDIIERNRSRVDGWLFSGPLPYELGRKYFRSDDNISCCHTAGAMLLVRALEVMHDAGRKAPRFSIDMYEGIIDISEVLSDTGLPLDEVYMKYYGKRFRVEEIVEFHRSLYAERKTDGAVTAFRAVYSRLKDLGVPAYYLNLTKAEITESLRQMVEKIRTTWFKATQVGTVAIAIHDYETVLDHMNSDVQRERLEWEIKGKLLPLCEVLDGSLVEKGNGRYEIFSSRGQIHRHLGELENTLKEIKMTINLYGSAAAGIGYGETVARSRLRARQAVDEPILWDMPVRISGDEAGEDREVQREELDPETREKLKEVRVNEKTLLKIRLAASSFPEGTFSVKDLSTKLSVTPQNIRRIMGALSKAGLAEIVSETSPAERGRPGKVYRLVVSF